METTSQQSPCPAARASSWAARNPGQDGEWSTTFRSAAQRAVANDLLLRRRIPAHRGHSDSNRTPEFASSKYASPASLVLRTPGSDECGRGAPEILTDQASAPARRSPDHRRRELIARRPRLAVPRSVAAGRRTDPRLSPNFPAARNRLCLQTSLQVDHRTGRGLPQRQGDGLNSSLRLAGARLARGYRCP